MQNPTFSNRPPGWSEEKEGCLSILMLQELSSSTNSEVLKLMLQSDSETPNQPHSNFFKEIEEMSENEFKRHFRMSKDLVNELVDAINVPVKPNFTLNAIEKVYVGLWYMANSCPYRIVARQFNLSMSTCFEVITEFMSCVVRSLRSEISFPTIDEEILEIPGCVGYVDGTHVHIKKPRDEPDIYYNRKSRYSLNVLAVCDYNMRFRYYYIGAFGSAHDSRVYRCSNLPELLNFSDDNLLILGDSAYPLTKHLLTPYPNPTTPVERNFNYVHKRQRVKIENAFGLWKMKWRRIKEVLDTNTINRAKLIIETSMLLHNFIITKDPTQPETEIEPDSNAECQPISHSSDAAGKERREQVANIIFMK